MIDTLTEDLSNRYLLTQPRVQNFGLLDLPLAKHPAGGAKASAAALYLCLIKAGGNGEGGGVTALAWDDVARSQALLAPSSATLLPDEFCSAWRSAQQEAVHLWQIGLRDEPQMTLELGAKDRCDLLVMNHAPMLVNYLVGLPFWWSGLNTSQQDVWARVLSMVVARACKMPSFRLSDFWRRWMLECEIRSLQHITPRILDSLKAHTSKPGGASGPQVFCLHMSMRTMSGGGPTSEQVQAVRNSIKRIDAVGVDEQGVLHAVLGIDRESCAESVLARLRAKFPFLSIESNF